MTSFKATVQTDTVNGGWSEGERRERSEKEREQPGRTGARERRKAAEKRQDRNNVVSRGEI